MEGEGRITQDMYAIVRTGGKQYQVSPGQTFEVDRLPVPEGEKIELDQVLLLQDGEKVVVGTPTVPGARVVATSLGEVKGEKVIVFKYKAKVRYRRKTGHRQRYTQLRVEDIRLEG
jgi:large subunit ribosomal protein L21